MYRLVPDSGLFDVEPAEKPKPVEFTSKKRTAEKGRKDEIKVVKRPVATIPVDGTRPSIESRESEPSEEESKCSQPAAVDAPHTVPLPESLFSTGVSAQQVAVPSDKVSQVTAMGFPEDNARSALANNGLDVQRAINWLLQNAG